MTERPFGARSGPGPTAPPDEGPRRPRIGMLGGTFDPPHNAHLALAEAARTTLDLDRIVFVPAGDPWRKRDREVTPAAARLEMVRVAVDELPWAEVSAIEVDRVGASYTADTLAALTAPREEPIRLLAAAWLGRTRLIDNIAVKKASRKKAGA